MDMIELDCPNCGALLQLDSGFAGGVCRCSECGTLMTVPSGSKGERAETLSRPDRPDAPGGRPEAPGQSARPESPGGRPEAPAASGMPGAAEADVQPAEPESVSVEASHAQVPAEEATADLAAASAAASKTSDVEVYYTASGKEVRVSRQARIPTAGRRKKVIKATGIGILVLMTLGIFAVIMFLINFLFSDPPPDGSDPGGVSVVGIADENFFLSDKPNFMGLPLSASTAVVVETYSFSKYWPDPVARAMHRVIDQAGTKTKLQFLFFTDAGVDALPPGGPMLMARDKHADLDQLIGGLVTIDTGAAIDGLNKAIVGKAEQIILVLGQRPTKTEVEAIAKAVEAAKDLKRLDAVLIDAHSEELQDLADGYGSLPLDKLNYWFEASQKGPEPEGASSALPQASPLAAR